MSSEFAQAQADIKSTEKKLTQQNLLDLYGMYKVATCGSVTGSRPGFMQPKARAKYDAWRSATEKHDDATSAELAYIELVNELK